MAKAESDTDKEKTKKPAAKRSPAKPKGAKASTKKSAKPQANPSAEPQPQPAVDPASGAQLPASRGKTGMFGGPKDRGFKPDDKLALPTGPHFAYERIRTLNPKGYYCAMRWDYRVGHRSPEEGKRWWANKRLVVSNPRNGKSVVVRAVDYGPHENTGLDISISPGAAEAIGVEIGDEVEIAFADEKAPLGPVQRATMIRYQAFDPPEYVQWQAAPEVVEEFNHRIEANAERRAIIRSLGPDQLISLYEGMVRNRLHDIALKRWVKQGVISKAWLGTGEEAATIGPVHALNRSRWRDGTPTDFVAPMIRNAGACHEMGMRVADMLRGYLGTDDSPTRGRDLHIGDFNRGVIAPISHVGDIMAVTNGIALAFKLRREPRVALTWIGDGSTKAGIFHESMNFAAVQQLPMIAIIQDNKVALGTRLDQHHRGSFTDWPSAYGVEGGSFDGNNLLDAYAAVKIAADGCREGRGPYLLIAETFRMGGHATHDEREARETFAAELFERWGKRDPVGLFETYLIEGTLDLESGRRVRRTQSLREKNGEVLRRAEQQVIQEIEQAIEEALESRRSSVPRPESAAERVYAETPSKSDATGVPAGAKMF